MTNQGDGYNSDWIDPATEKPNASTVAQITESIFNIFSKVDFDFDNGLLTYDEARNRAVQETAEVITTLTQLHQDQLAEVYREIQNRLGHERTCEFKTRKNDLGHYYGQPPRCICQIKTIEYLAERRGIDISDKK